MAFLEHIATADMAIIGKGILAAPAKNSDFEARLEEKINTLLTASLNIAANAKIIGRSYQGEFLGKAVYQKWYIVWIHARLQLFQV